MYKKSEREKHLVSHYIRECQWLTQHNNKHFYGFNSPAKLWSTEIENVSFLPVKFITGRYGACKEGLKFQNNNSRYSDIINIIIK